MTNAVRDSPVLGYKPDPFSQRYVLEFSILENGIGKASRIETLSLNVMADDETGIRLFSSTEKDNTILVVSHASRCLFLVCYSKEKIDSANGLGFTYLYLCRKSAH